MLIVPIHIEDKSQMSVGTFLCDVWTGYQRGEASQVTGTAAWSWVYRTEPEEGVAK